MNKAKVSLALCSLLAGVSVVSGQTNLIPESGKVSIGTGTPGTAILRTYSNDYWQLQFDNPGTNGSTWYLGASSDNWAAGGGKFLIDNIGSSSGAEFAIDSNGNIGIGDAWPGNEARLNIKNQGVWHVFLKNEAASTNWYVGASGTGWSAGSDKFLIGNQGSSSAAEFCIDSSGRVGIGTVSPSKELSVNGTIQAKEVIVETGWSDYVFEEGYYLRPLDEVKAHIEEHGHLPDVPSASTVKSQGLSVGEAQKIMMQKIEELTLYVIAQQNEIDELKATISQQRD